MFLRNKIARFAATTLCVAMTVSAWGSEQVNESARAIPVASEVDILVVGGSTGAVAAATAAAAAGAKVFLLAERPYLGDDMTATLRLWPQPGDELDTPLAKQLFADPRHAKNSTTSPPRPMHVKKTLDEALLAAGVHYLYNCSPCDVLRDADDQPCGIVMANRAGRQAIIAKVIIDATQRAIVSRRAGARFRPYPPDPQTMKYVVIGGDNGWNYRQWRRDADGTFRVIDPGPLLSRLDRLILTLGNTHDRRAVPVIVEKLQQLDAEDDFSHHRTVALALETLADPAAAGPLAELLARPGMSGHTHSSIEIAMERQRPGAGRNNVQCRQDSLRELMLARALYRCGDHEQLGESILREYTHDLRGHFSRHAQAVLSTPRPPRKESVGR